MPKKDEHGSRCRGEDGKWVSAEKCNLMAKGKKKKKL